MTLQSYDLEELKSQTVSRQGTTREFQTKAQRETALFYGFSSLKCEVDLELAEIAVCLTARDYKGFQNRGSNGVFEWKITGAKS